jgi:sigma-B regulation protein RsbU (phosphoserine phosphatase)
MEKIMAAPDRPDSPASLEEENRRLRRAVAELTILNELASAIDSTMTTDEIMNLIVQESIKAIGVEQGAIMMITEKTASPMKTLIRGMDAASGGIPYRLGVSLTGWMLKNQKPLLIEDFGTDDRFRGVKVESGQIRSVLSIPLKAKDRMIGVINLINKKEGTFTHEDERLAGIIATQSAQVLENARLYEEEKRLQQMDRELQMARDIQKSLLPTEPPQLPGASIAGLSHPAREVGGDYYDFIHLGSGRLGVVIADVSGKGVPASLLMSNIQATLRVQAVSSSSPGHCIAEANTALHKSTAADKYATLFYGILDPAEKTFTSTNAGHNAPMLISEGKCCQRLETGGIVLGMLPDMPYQDEKTQLHPGDLLLMFSDGITEAMNDHEEEFGEERLKSLLDEHRQFTPDDLLEKIVAEVNAFTGGSRQQDDMTLVAIKIH